MSYNSKYTGAQVENKLDAIESLQTQLSGKQEEIPDLELIRSGAAKGATALQKHQDISGKLDKKEASDTYATKTELETRNAGMAETSEEVEDVESEFATKGYVNSAIIGAINKEY